MNAATIQAATVQRLSFIGRRSFFFGESFTA